MPVLADYTRFRWTWGGIDFQHGSGHPYGTSDTGPSAGASAAAGAGVGVRRAVLHVDRTGLVAGADDAEFHFDFLNITGGSPDDTWTSTDYSTLEGYLDTFWTAVKGYVSPGCKLSQYSWYRHGPGVGSPNPAERVTARSVVGTSGSGPLPPQDAATITLRTSVRRSWGRTYLPGLCENAMDGSSAHFSHAFCDNVGNAAAALLHSAIGGDFPMVVTSIVNSAVLNVEHIAVDDLADVIRRRRWKTASYKKILP